MTLLDTGITGAKRMSWKLANPRALLEEILKESPDADVETLRSYCRTAVRKAGKDFVDTVFDYWFDNTLRSLMHQPSLDEVRERRERSAKLVSETVARGSAAVAKVIEKKAKTLLLDTILPNGKKLRDSTFGECRIFGGWLSRIGRKGNPDKLVGRYLSEAKVRALKSA